MANVFNVELVHLSIKHGVLNLIKLAYTSLKTHVRSRFRLSDIRSLSEEYITALDDETNRRFIGHARKVEEKFLTTHDFVAKDIVPHSLSEDEHDQSYMNISTDDEEDARFRINDCTISL